MLRLINAGLHRYMETVVFWVMIGMAVFDGLFMGIVTSPTSGMALFATVGLYLIYTILIPLSLGGDFKYGTLRSKLISGNPRTRVFFAEVLVSVIVMLIMFGAMTIAFLPFGLKTALNMFTGRQLFDMVRGVLACHLCMVILVTVLTFVLPERYGAVLAVMLAFVGISGYISMTGTLKYAITAPEYMIDYIEYPEDEFGIPDYSAPPVNIYKVKNIDYIPRESIKYKVLYGMYHAMPTTAMMEYTEAYTDRESADVYYDGTELESGDITVDEYGELVFGDDRLDIKPFELWQLGTAAVLLVIGYVWFRRSNIR